MTGEYHLEHIFNAKHQVQSLPWQITAHEPVRSAIDRAFASLVREAVAAGCAHRPGARWIGDRTPREMLDICPGGRFFWIVRDGRSVVASWSRHLLAQQPEVILAAVPPHAGRDAMLPLASAARADPTRRETALDELLGIEAWVRFASAAWARRWRSDLGCAQHFERPGAPTRVLRLRYEAIAADVEGERTRMYRFLDLDPALARPISRESGAAPAPGCLEPHRLPRRALAWFEEAAGRHSHEAGYGPGIEPELPATRTRRARASDAAR